MHLGGKTAGNYSAVTWSYNITTKSCDLKACPIIYFHDVQNNNSAEKDAKCINTTANYGMDPRIIALSPAKVEVGLNRNCSKNGDYIVCVGALNVSIGFRHQFAATLGFECGQTQAPLDVEFSINITGYNNGEIPCTDWSHALDELSPPFPPGLKRFIDICSAMYGKFSRWNGLGFSLYHFKYCCFIQRLSFHCLAIRD